ncbi:MAG: hypothetical protein RL682_336 [Pseudomonadota bacterium]|jgi:hypothetical protein
MTKLTTPKLFGALGPDDSYFDARTKAAAKDAQQRWPLFKAIAPQSSGATPVLSTDEKARWGQVETVPQEIPKPALSRPGLSAKLALGLGKIARQTSVETPPSNPRVDIPSVFVAPPIPVQAHAPAQEASSEMPLAKRASRHEAGTPPPAAPSEVVFTKQKKLTGAAPKSATATDDSLSSIFQRVEGGVKTPIRIAVARKGAMKRLGKR